MLPSIDLRITNMIKAISDIVLPALPAHEKLAQEQARLIIGHLAIIKDQWKLAVRFERGSFEAMHALAEKLVGHVDGEQAAALRAAITMVALTDRADSDALVAGIKTLGTAVDAVILGDDGTRPLSKAAQDAVLDYGERQAMRERTWFAGTGIDPDKSELPSLSEVI